MFVYSLYLDGSAANDSEIPLWEALVITIEELITEAEIQMEMEAGQHVDDKKDWRSWTWGQWHQRWNFTLFNSKAPRYLLIFKEFSVFKAGFN